MFQVDAFALRVLVRFWQCHPFMERREKVCEGRPNSRYNFCPLGDEKKQMSNQNIEK